MTSVADTNRKMVSGPATLAFCALYLPCVYGLDWMANYMDGMKEQIIMHGLQQFPEKTRGRNTNIRDFVCPVMSPSAEVPTTADRVRPADVKIVAALGDSLTAAIGANASHILEIPTEYRQFSWSIGGHGNLSDIITLPNILKKFNPRLVGFAKRSTLSYKPAPLEDAGLNLAITGANTLLLPEQARHLINTLKSLPGVDFEDDWKVVTIFIGSNDLCDYCKDKHDIDVTTTVPSKTLFSAESFIHNVTVSLDLLKAELPRSIVNVVQLLHITHLRQVNDNSVGCILQRVFCSCVVQPKDNSPELLDVLDQNKQFQEKLEHLIQRSGRYEGKRDFAVVLQPFLEHIEPATDQDGHIDYSFFTPDCFHLTIKGHEQMATGLWNNMLQPYGEKTRIKSFSEEVKLLCPSEDHPYIYTKAPETESPSGASWAARGSGLLNAFLLLAALLGASP